MGKNLSFWSFGKSERERASDSADSASCGVMTWRASWKYPSSKEEEGRGESEVVVGRGVVVVAVVVVAAARGERRVERERVGGRRWNRRERVSAASEEQRLG